MPERLRESWYEIILYLDSPMGLAFESSKLLLILHFFSFANSAIHKLANS
ncbi:MAG: hypothetical protein ACI85I_000679 [Arenicella sp.]|jgi:hypothetical protein